MNCSRSFLLAVLLASGCATAPVGEGPAASPKAALPTGAQLSASGYLTIREAPPSPFPEEPPPEPQLDLDSFERRVGSPDPAVRAKAWEEANGSPAFQAELQRLQQVLPGAEPDNFVQLRLVRDPAVAAEAWFKRDAAPTLARYTSNPLIRPRQGGLSAAEQDRLRSLWHSRMMGQDLVSMMSIDSLTGEVELGIAVEETEFRRRAVELGWELGPNVKLDFPPAKPTALADASLASYVRAFARETRAKHIQLTAGYSGHIVLEDGCFRLSNLKSGEPGALVVFGRQTQLGLDRQGYLVVTSAGPREENVRRYRIGELGSWPGPNTVDEDDPEVRELRRRCGTGPITNVAEPQSERLFATPYADWVADYARAKSQSYREAWREVIACMNREVGRGRRGMEARERCIRQYN